MPRPPPWPALVLALVCLAAVSTPSAAAPAQRTLSDCLAELRDRFPAENGTAPTEALRRALAAAGSQLGAALITANEAGSAPPGSNLTAQALGAAPFTAFVTVSDKFDSLASDPAAAGPPPPGLSPAAARERELFRAFHAGLPREKQAAWVLYNLVPAALTADQLGSAKTVVTHLSEVVGSPDYDLAFALPPNFALGGAVRVRDRLGQDLQILSSFKVCEGWVHTVDGLLWPGTTPDPASIPDPVQGGVDKGGSRRTAAAPFSADRLTLPPGLAGADPNRIASTAFQATGAALDAAVATIQGSINSTGGGGARAGRGGGGLPPLPPPFGRPGGSASTAAGDLDALPPSRARTVGAVVGGVVGGLVGVGVVAALAATLLLSARARRQTTGGGGGGRGGGGAGRTSSSCDAGEGEGESGDGPADPEKGGGGGSKASPPRPPPPAPPGTPSARAKALLARAMRGGTAGGAAAAGGGGGGSSAALGDDTAGSRGFGAAPPHGRPASSASTASGGDAAAAAEWEMDPADIAFCTDPATGRRWRLGSGGFGDVYRARYQGSTDVAVKLVAGASPREQARFANEVAILKALRHTNVVQFLGAALEPAPAPAHAAAERAAAAAGEDEDDPGAHAPPFHPGPRIMLVTEYMPRGDLWRALAKDQGGSGGGGGPGGPPGGALTGRVFGWYRRGRGVALDVTRALAFMHSKKVLHCDVKSSNILLGRDGTAKLADVGLARFLTRDATIMSREGTFDWSSPELLAGRGVTEKSDVWSLGVVLWEVASGDRPRLRQMRRLRVPEECPAEVAAIIDACRAVEPGARPTAREVYERLAAAPAGPGPGGQQRGGGGGGGGGVGGAPSPAQATVAQAAAPAGSSQAGHNPAASPFAQAG